MLTFDAAEQQGYAFADEQDGSVEVTLNDVHVVTVHSTCPKFFALRYVAAELGDDLATTEVTVDLVQQVSGETYVEPDVAPSPPPLADAIEQAVASVPDDGTVADLKTAILSAISAAAS